MKQNQEIWTGNNYFFFEGIRGISSRFMFDTNRENFFFVYLTGYTLNYFMHEFHKIRRENVVIIYNPKLLPLAYFWFRKRSSVRAIFRSDTSVDTIILKLNKFKRDGSFTPPSIENGKQLTDRDVRLINDYFEHQSIKSLQRKYCYAYTTVHRWIMSVSYKFDVRKLKHLLLVK